MIKKVLTIIGETLLGMLVLGIFVVLTLLAFTFLWPLVILVCLIIAGWLIGNIISVEIRYKRTGYYR